MIALLVASFPLDIVAQSGGASPAPAPFNLVTNGSFAALGTMGPMPWDWGGMFGEEWNGGDVDGDGGSIQVCGVFKQTLLTIPGRTYRLRFAYRPSCDGTWMDVTWGSNKVDHISSPQVVPWEYHTYKVVAQTTNTWLTFNADYICPPALDDVSVIEDPDQPVTGSVPAISAIADQMTKKEVPVTIAFTVGDAVTPADELQVLVHSSTASLVPDANVVCAGTGSIRTLTITPALGATGWTPITLAVLNHDGNSAYSRFGLAVIPANTPPRIAAIPDQVTVSGLPLPIVLRVSDEETPQSVSLSAKAADPGLVPDGNLSFGYDPAFQWSPYLPVLTIVPATNQTGTTTITVTGTDPQGGTAQRRFLLSVLAPTLPWLSPIPDQVTTPGALLTIPFQLTNQALPVGRLTVAARSSDHDLVSDYALWLNIDQTGDADYATPGTLTLRTSEHAAGIARITLTASEGTVAATREFAVEVPWVATIAHQPQDQTVVAGESVAFSVGAESVGPVQYQWRFNGIPIEGATNATFSLPQATAGWQGWFTVAVATPYATNLSDPAILLLAGPGGEVLFANIDSGDGIDAPVFAADGVTRLEGGGYAAQLYAGPTPTNLVAVGPAVPFLTGINAGYWSWSPDGVRSIPSVPPGQPAYVQARVWESAAGITFEQAVAAGAQNGTSDVLEVITGDAGQPPSFPAPLIGLKSFRLQSSPVGVAGGPAPLSMQLESNDSVSRAPVVLSVGNSRAGEVYEVQASSDLMHWVLAARTLGRHGLTRFMILSPIDSTSRFYRAASVSR